MSKKLKYKVAFEINRNTSNVMHWSAVGSPLSIWCNEHIGKQYNDWEAWWGKDDVTFYFKDEAQAVHFKLTWSDYASAP